MDGIELRCGDMGLEGKGGIRKVKREIPKVAIGREQEDFELLD